MQLENGWTRHASGSIGNDGLTSLEVKASRPKVLIMVKPVAPASSLPLATCVTLPH